jgi:septal ring factor EnvC (AmiA/AmiB activator)
MSEHIDIELLKKDVNILTSLCTKLDISIDKMQEIASNLSHMVSLQQQRLDIQEKTTKEIESTLEMRRIEHNNDIKDLHSRMNSVNKELNDKIEESENKILAELQSLREELKKDKDTLGKRIFEIESWKWMVMGGLFVLGWIASKVLSTIKFF